jgi:hypothetical protein
MKKSLRIIRNLDLEPAWNVKQAKEPGFMRSLISWAGGPEGYLNENPEKAVISDRCAVGLMRMPVGNRQAGVPHAVRTTDDEDLQLIWVHDALEKNGTPVYLDRPGPFPADDTVSPIPFLELEPNWGEERAKEPGFLRWVVNWVGGCPR